MFKYWISFQMSGNFYCFVTVMFSGIILNFKGVSANVQVFLNWSVQMSRKYASITLSSLYVQKEEKHYASWYTYVYIKWQVHWLVCIIAVDATTDKRTRKERKKSMTAEDFFSCFLSLSVCLSVWITLISCQCNTVNLQVDDWGRLAERLWEKQYYRSYTRGVERRRRVCFYAHTQIQRQIQPFWNHESCSINILHQWKFPYHWTCSSAVQNSTFAS